MNVTVIAVDVKDAVTWNLGSEQYIKSGSYASDGQNIFVSTDESASELLYVASGGDVKSQKGYEYLDTNGKTKYNKDKTLLNRYFVTPPLSGSGTLTVTYAALDKGRSNVQVRDGGSSTSTSLGTITFSDNSIQLENLNKTTLYLTSDDDKIYAVGITWAPEAGSDPTGVKEVQSAETSVTAIKAKKFFKNGRLIIEANGKQFNATGAQIK